MQVEGGFEDAGVSGDPVGVAVEEVGGRGVGVVGVSGDPVGVAVEEVAGVGVVEGGAAAGGSVSPHPASTSAARPDATHPAKRVLMPPG